MNINLLKEKIKVSGIKFQNIAIEIGISRQQLYNIFAGKQNLNVDVLEKICKIIDVPISIFFDNMNPVLEAKQSQSVVCPNCEFLKEQLAKCQGEKNKLYDIIENLTNGNGNQKKAAG